MDGISRQMFFVTSEKKIESLVKQDCPLIRMYGVLWLSLVQEMEAVRDALRNARDALTKRIHSM